MADWNSDGTDAWHEQDLRICGTTRPKEKATPKENKKQLRERMERDDKIEETLATLISRVEK